MDKSQFNGTIDIMKFIMSILVVAIHTEPFAFSFWLDKGLGILTRLCVPFFFVTSSYFFWKKYKNNDLCFFKSYIHRILQLYICWTLLYLPIDFNRFAEMDLSKFFSMLLWSGNGHALWFLCASIYGVFITYVLFKWLKSEKVILMMGTIVLMYGCLKSSWEPLASSLFNLNIPDVLGYRNGLFYAFPYMALGLYIARTNITKDQSNRKNFVLFIICLILLAIESSFFVLYYKTTTTILWISTLPCMYYFIRLLLGVNIVIKRSVSLTLRHMSTLIYVSHGFFLLLFSEYSNNMAYFILVIAFTMIISFLIYKLSSIKQLQIIKNLF